MSVAGKKTKAKNIKEGKRSQEERTNEAKAKIIESAFKCIGKKGFHKTTFIDIAKEAGCSRELPRYHFGSREGLISELLKDAAGKWFEYYSSLSDRGIFGLKAMLHIADTFEKLFMEESSRLRGIYILIFGIADPGTDQKLQKQLSKSQKLTEDSFHDLIKRDVNINSSDPDIQAELIYATLRGLIYKWILDSKGFDIKATMAQFKNMVKLILADANSGCD